MTFDPTQSVTLHNPLEIFIQHASEGSCVLPYVMLRISGPERISFLNRVLTQNVSAPSSMQIFSWVALCNPQGRVLAAFRMLAQTESVVLLAERELANLIFQTLKRYVLRSQIEITIEPGRLQGFIGPPASASHSRMNTGSTLLGLDPHHDKICRWIYHCPTEDPSDLADPHTESIWKAFDFWMGIPHVLITSSGRFIPHALNLIELDAVSLRKGCYPGQEIIARTTYRGKAKRTLALFATTAHVEAGMSLRDAHTTTDTAWVLDCCLISSGEFWVQAVVEDRIWESDSKKQADRSSSERNQIPDAYQLVLPSGASHEYQLLRIFKAA